MTSFKRKTLIASTLACGLLAALQLPQAMARNDHAGQHGPNAHSDMSHGLMGLDRMSDRGTAHNNMDHERNMQRMHENRGQMDHGNMGQGRQNHGLTPPSHGKGRKNDRY